MPPGNTKSRFPSAKGKRLLCREAKIIVENYLCEEPPLALPLLMPSLITCACMCCASSKCDCSVGSVFWANCLTSGFCAEVSPFLNSEMSFLVVFHHFLRIGSVELRSRQF